MALTPGASAPPRFTRSPHLVALIAEAERLAAAVAGADPAARAELADRRTREAALASVRLDGSDLHDEPTAEAIAQAQAVGGVTEVGPERFATWFEAMRIGEDLDPEHTAQLHALEFAGVVAATASDDLATRLLSDPLPALAELHARLTAGLVAPERAGAPRQREQAVHDASVGRILYFTTDPAAVPGDLALLGAWLASTGAREHGLVAAGVAHLELLRIHPFDAANGRLARAASRLVLRTRGLDPDGLAAPEVALDRDRLAYHDEVARTLRRRDLTIWLERWGEAVTDGLRDAARQLGQLAVDVPAAATDFLADHPDGFTVADHRAAAGRSPAESRSDLEALLDAGLVARVPGTRGLRFATTIPPKSVT